MRSNIWDLAVEITEKRNMSYYLTIVETFENNIKHYEYIVMKSYCTHKELSDQGFDIHGCYGREDYAAHWRDYKNGDLTEKEHEEFLYR